MAQKILVVDDDKAVVELISKILAEHNYEVASALDGKEGYDKIKTESPDLIVLDIRLPSMNGYEFIRSLRSEMREEGKPLIPVVILTAKESLEEVFKMEGAKGYLVKPVDPGKLIQTIEKCLADHD